MYLKILVGLIFCLSLISSRAWSSETLSYSGRLVGTNGAPISGPVNLRFNLAYTSNPSVVLCSDEVLNVTLSHGVFHAKLDFDCGASSFNDVLAGIPLGSSVAIQTVDITNTPHKSYSYQAMHSVPFSVLAEKAKELGPLNASSAGEVLTWNGSKWVAAPPAMSSGTVFSITAQDGLSGGTITSSGSIGIADAGVTAAKLHSMGATTSGQVLKWNGSNWTAGADEDNGVVEGNIRKFALNNDPLTPAPTCSGQQVLRYVLLTDSLECFDLMTDDIDVTKSNLAPSQKAVAEALDLKQDKIESSLKLTHTDSSWVSLEAPAGGGNISYTLPLMGTSGQVLKLGASGVLTWGDTGVSGSDIAANSITNTHVADGALSQSKISGLTTDLAAIDTRITNLKTDDVAEGTTNKYFTNERVLLAPLTGLSPTTGPVSAMDSILVAFNKIVGNANDLSGAVTTLATNQNNYLLKDGTSAMSGNLDMGGNGITNLSAPGSDSDAATKKYVDDKANVATTWLKNDPDIYYNAGKIGIGTTTPSSIFHISPPDDTWASSLRIDRSWDSATDFAQIMYDYQGLKIRTMDNGDDEAHIIFKPKDSEALRITETGNVGIGTTTPQEKLHVNGTIKAGESISTTGSLLLVDTHSSGSTTNIGTEYSSGGPVIGYGVKSGNAVGSFVSNYSAGLGRSALSISDSLRFYTGVNQTVAIDSPVTVTERMRITNSGNVGIGTSTPNSKLTVDGVLALKEGAAPALTADYGKLYVGTDSKLYFLNGLGTTTVLGSSDGGTPGDNTITSDKITDGSIVNADINASAGIDATKLGTGVVDNTELSYLNGVTGPIQTQLSNIRQVPAGSDTTKYLKGDNTWETLSTSVVPEGTNKYFTSALMQSTLMTSYVPLPAAGLTATDSLVQALGKLQGQISSNDADISTLNGKGQWEKNLTNVYYNGGNVGIGTNTPLGKLDVAGGVRFAGSNAANGLSSTSNFHMLAGNDGTGNESFVFETAATGEVARILPSGNFGIGTAVPVSKLHVASSTNTQIRVEAAGAGAQAEYYSVANGTSWVIGTGAGNPGSTDLGFYNSGNKMVLTTTGLLGIGSVAPSERLDVAGNVKATAYLYTSDRRLKENIETIENSSEKVLALRGVEFDWKQDGKHEIGFIAQEVEAIEPNLVVTSEVDGIKAVKYGNVVALLVEAFKEHHQKLEENQKLFMTMNQGMNTRVKELEREVASLKDENKKLKEDIELIKKHLKIK